jgi:uncharacterized membrane protein YedE/YeeE
MEWLSQPWPWYIAGPLIGLMVPALLLLDNRPFGISSSYRHVCAAILPGRSSYFAYDWKETGKWNLGLALGTLVGGFVASVALANPEPVAISAATQADLLELGLRDLSGLVPAELFSWSGLQTLPGMILLVVGGFLVGFGARYAGGCTSGHAIFGLADAQLPSLIAVLGFFAGGLMATHLLLPMIL